MKIRATKKILTISKIKEIKDTSSLADSMPGEWYASIVSAGQPGKLAIHFLHYPTLISVIIAGKSLNKALLLFPEHVASLLERHGYSKLLPEYQVTTAPEIFATNDRSMLSYMNDMRWTIEYHLVRNEPMEKIEDIEFGNLFGGKLGGKDYTRPKEILERYLSSRP